MRRSTDLDEVLADDLADEWRRCIAALENLASVLILRRRVPADLPNDWKYEFHMFSDSSKDVAAVAVSSITYRQPLPC